MVITDDIEYNAIWNRVYKELKFFPSCFTKDHSMDGRLPFEISLPYSVYAIENMQYCECENSDELIRESLVRSTPDNRRWYALDWQHSAFIFDPNNIEEQQNTWVDDKRYLEGGYWAYFPSFYPDGDYYFFIDETFENGYLGHPWRKEVWIFGSKLKNEIEKIYSKLNWYLIK